MALPVWLAGFAIAVLSAFAIRYFLPRGVSRAVGTLVQIAAWLIATAIGAFALWTASGIQGDQSGWWLLIGLMAVAAFVVVAAGRMLRGILRD